MVLKWIVCQYYAKVNLENDYDKRRVIPFIAICTLLSKAQDKENKHKSMKKSISNSYSRKHEKCITKDKSYNVPWEHPLPQ